MSHFRAMQCLSFCLALASFAFTLSAAPQNSDAFHRVAVIGTSLLQQQGITVVVSNELQEAGVEPVEREQLDRVVREKILTAALGPDSIKNRVDLGKLLKADALVLMSDEGNGKDRRLRIVIAECRHGARLGTETFPLDDISTAARDAAVFVRKTRQHFAGGLKAIIAIPPFITHNFTYEYHPLQVGYAVLLQKALSELDGVAVLEVEEARAIRKELELGGGEISRVVPLIIEGEFAVAQAPARPLVQLSISARTSASSTVVTRKDMTLDEASRFVARDLVGEVLPQFKQGVERPFSADAEFAQLASRADAFRKVGEWRLAAQMREAALVLRPGDVDQREKLVNDALKFVETVAWMPNKPAGAAWERIADSVFQCWQSAIESLEWLVRHEYPARENVGRAVNAISCVHETAVAESAQTVRRDFLERVYPLTLPRSQTVVPGRTEAIDLRPDWANKAILAAIHPARRVLVKEDYNTLLKLLDIIPEDIEPSNYLTGLLWGTGGRGMRDTAEYADFVHRLGQSNRRMLQILSRVATMSLQVERGETLDRSLLAEIHTLKSDYLANKLAPCGQWSVPPVPDRLDQLEVIITDNNSARNSAETDAARIRHWASPRAMANNEHIIELPEEAPAMMEAGALRFERIALRDAQENTSPGLSHPPTKWPGLDHLVPCGDSMDVLWDSTRVNSMRASGALKPLVSSKNSRTFGDVRWDGRHLWIATYGELYRVDTGGGKTIPSKLPEELPPFDHAVLLYPLGPDRLIVAGVFGPSQRSFLALIEGDGGRYKHKLLLQAARIDIRDEEARDADLAFTPRQLVPCKSPDGGDYLIVLRGGPTLAAIRHPLIVDLKTFDVRVSATPIASTSALGVNGKLLQCLEGREEFVLWRLSNDARGFVADLPHIKLPEDRGDPWSGPNNPTWTVGADGNVYIPGYSWFRVDPVTMTAQCLAEEGPPFAPLQQIAATRGGILWWGMVGGKGTNLYRVKVDDSKLKLPARRDWQPPAPSAKNLPPASMFDATLRPSAVGGRVSGTLVLTRPADPPYTRKLRVCLMEGDRMLSQSSQRISLTTRDPSNPLLHYQWRARIEDSGTRNEPFIISQRGDYRVELTLCSDDDAEKPLDHRILNLSVK